jgi:hypothetical protein
MSYRNLLSLSVALLLSPLACGPAPSTSGTDSETGGGSSSSSSSTPTTTDTTADPTSTSTSTSTGTGVTSGATVEPGDESESESDTVNLPEPGVPLDQFTCAGAKWVYVEPARSRGGGSVLASNGHYFVTSSGHIVEFDTSGALVSDVDYGMFTWSWGGLDAADHLYLAYGDEGRRWLRKFDLSGALVWEVDRGPLAQPNAHRGRVAVAPDGTSLVYTQVGRRLERFAADGGLLYDKQAAADVFNHVPAMNGAGEAVALRYGLDGQVVVLDPDAEVIWQQPLTLGPRGWADIDAAGNVSVATSGSLQIRRFAAGGALAWDVTLALGEGEGESAWVTDLVTNEAGETAVAASATSGEQSRAFAVKLDADGAVLATHSCDLSSDASTVAIDEAGAVYLAGAVYAEDGLHLFAAAFE